MARVFDAFDDRLERPVAVKILRPETEALPGMRQRFQQEARLAARLIHPHIVAVLDYGEDDALSYLVMERLPGTTLRDEIARGPLAPSRVLLVVTEALTALVAAHKFGVLHRDVKPSNILLQDDGHTKITDFGIAKSCRRQDRGGGDDRRLDAHRRRPHQIRERLRGGRRHERTGAPGGGHRRGRGAHARRGADPSDPARDSSGALPRAGDLLHRVRRLQGGALRRQLPFGPEAVRLLHRGIRGHGGEQVEFGASRRRRWFGIEG